ncbi:MAG: glycosyltransferase family 4 protein [Polyangiaceae bacterium]|nr:glycosyltransferase family 4 protein [Polyangiaceae bacterium]
MLEPRILFVSKPMAPPWNDGSKNLVRDIAANLTRARAAVMITKGGEPIGPRVSAEPIYRDAGRFAPSVTANARVALRLLTGDPLDAWHFVFAPNPLSSSVALFAKMARRAAGWRGRVVQTVASAPRTFDGAARWIFGDVVVTLSEHTRQGLFGAGVNADLLRVIPPCARAPRVLSQDERARVRARYHIGDGPVVLYPGDYEVSHGAQTVAAAVPAIVRAFPDTTIVFACRKKKSDAKIAQRIIERDLDRCGAAAKTRHLGEVSSMADLLSIASVVAFPVDDLYGKVDLPLVLLEAMALGIPLVVARGGPLETFDFAPMVNPGDPHALAEHVIELLANEDIARAIGRQGMHMYHARYTPEIVASAYDDLYAELLG